MLVSRRTDPRQFSSITTSLQPVTLGAKKVFSCGSPSISRLSPAIKALSSRAAAAAASKRGDPWQCAAAHKQTDHEQIWADPVEQDRLLSQVYDLPTEKKVVCWSLWVRSTVLTDTSIRTNFHLQLFTSLISVTLSVIAFWLSCGSTKASLDKIVLSEVQIIRTRAKCP